MVKFVEFDTKAPRKIYFECFVNAAASILVGVTSRSVHIKVEGKGSFQISPALKEFSKRMLDRGFRSFIVDLNSCSVMDSTFMGTLAGIALRLREFGNGCLVVRNANKRNADLLENLGLNNLFEIESKVPSTKSETSLEAAPLEPTNSMDRSDQATCMIEAHEALVDADPENLARFKDVLEYLKQDLRSGSR
jgi:anti-sigma B factor antagonist